MKRVRVIAQGRKSGTTCCEACDVLHELFKFGLSNRGYWLLTELFMELHNGHDYCESAS